MKKSAGLISMATLVVVVVSFDLGSKHSWLGQVMEKGRASLASGKKSPESSAGKAEAAPDKLRAEAREIWARMSRLTEDEFVRLHEQFFEETDPGKRYALLRAMGFTLSRKRFDQVLQIPIQIQDGNEKYLLFQNLIKAWCDESPREAVAWVRCHVSLDPFGAGRVFLEDQERSLCYSLHASQRDPEAWAAFLKECPDPGLLNKAQALQRELKEPGSLWLAKDYMLHQLAFTYVRCSIEEGAHEAAFKSLVKCPFKDRKKEMAVLLSEHLSSQSLRRSAIMAAGDDKDMANFYSALAGGEWASYSEASDYIMSAGSGYSHSEKAFRRLYPEWLKRDGLDPVFDQVKNDGSNYIHVFMQAAVKEGLINEEYIVRRFAGQEPPLNDEFIVALYTAQHGNDYRTILESIRHSTGIEDQVATSGGVLEKWSAQAPEQAVQWFKSLPTHGDLPELAAKIAYQWLTSDADSGVAFILAEQLGLGHGVKESLQYVLNEDKISAPVMKQLMRSMRDELEYDEFLFYRASYLLSNDLPTGIQFLQEHSPGPWQTFVVDQMNAWIDNSDYRIVRLMPALMKLDFSGVPSEKLKPFNDARDSINKAMSEGDPFLNMKLSPQH